MGISIEGRSQKKEATLGTVKERITTVSQSINMRIERIAEVLDPTV